MAGREDKRMNNKTMLPTLKNNAAAGYKGPVKMVVETSRQIVSVLHELLKGKYHANLSVISKPKNVCLLTETKIIV